MENADGIPTPNLFLVGAPKCGTTSLYEYLRQHPQIFFPFDEEDYSRVKEPNHFCPELEIKDKDAIKSREEYLNLYRGSGHFRWRGDASTNYLFSESAAERIKRFCPQARILIALRPPVAMMRSYHNELLRHGHEDIEDFHEALRASEDRRNGMRIPPFTSVPKCLDYYSISRFAPQVERYYRVFGKDAVKVILLEDLTRNPAETYREILAFLGIDSSFQPELRVYNETPRNGSIERLITLLYRKSGIKYLIRPFVSYEGRRKFLSMIRRYDHGRVKPGPAETELLERSAGDVDRLGELIGRDLGHWHSQARRRNR